MPLYNLATRRLEDTYPYVTQVSKSSYNPDKWSFADGLGNPVYWFDGTASYASQSGNTLSASWADTAGFSLKTKAAGIEWDIQLNSASATDGVLGVAELGRGYYNWNAGAWTFGHRMTGSSQLIGTWSFHTNKDNYAIGPYSIAHGYKNVAVDSADSVEGYSTSTVNDTVTSLNLNFIYDSIASTLTSLQPGDFTTELDALDLTNANLQAWFYNSVDNLIYPVSVVGSSIYDAIADRTYFTVGFVGGSDDATGNGFIYYQTFSSTLKGEPLANHAEGDHTIASGDSTHAEGRYTRAYGVGSHAEGLYSISSNSGSHAEGRNTEAKGDASHAEGSDTIASGSSAHAQGYATLAQGEFSHAEGFYTIATGDASHAGGRETLASGYGARAIGYQTNAVGDYSSAEGYNTDAIGLYSKAAGQNTIASGSFSHAEGSGTNASASGSHAEGLGTSANANYAHTEGIGTTAYGTGSHAEGNASVTYARYSHAEGDNTSTYGTGSHAEGYYTIASGSYSHTEGSASVAYADYSHTEGGNTVVSGSNVNANFDAKYSHAEGEFSTVRYARASHAEGYNTLVYNADYSHAEGYESQVYPNIKSSVAIHAEGYQTTAKATAAHSEGSGSVARGIASHAEGWSTITSASYQHATGRWNLQKNIEDYFVIGDGSDEASRSNAFGVNATRMYASNSIFFPDLTDVFKPHILVFDTGSKQVFYYTGSGLGGGGGAGTVGPGTAPYLAYFNSSNTITSNTIRYDLAENRYYVEGNSVDVCNPTYNLGGVSSPYTANIIEPDAVSLQNHDGSNIYVNNIAPCSEQIEVPAYITNKALGGERLLKRIDLNAVPCYGVKFEYSLTLTPDQPAPRKQIGVWGDVGLPTPGTTNGYQRPPYTETGTITVTFDGGDTLGQDGYRFLTLNKAITLVQAPTYNWSNGPYPNATLNISENYVFTAPTNVQNSILSALGTYPHDNIPAGRGFQFGYRVFNDYQTPSTTYFDWVVTNDLGFGIGKTYNMYISFVTTMLKYMPY